MQAKGCRLWYSCHIIRSNIVATVLGIIKVISRAFINGIIEGIKRGILTESFLGSVSGKIRVVI